MEVPKILNGKGKSSAKIKEIKKFKLTTTKKTYNQNKHL